MVEQEIARFIAQHFMQRRPRRLPHRAARRRASRSTRSTSSPSRDSMYRATARRFLDVARGADACASAHGDFARDRAALRRRAVAREFRMPRPHGRRRDLGEPEIRRPAVPLARLGGDASIGRDQRKLAIERLFRGEDDAQRRALPRRDRRGQDREPGRVLAAVGRSLRPVRPPPRRKMRLRSATMLGKAANRRAGNKAIPLGPPSRQLNDIM